MYIIYYINMSKSNTHNIRDFISNGNKSTQPEKMIESGIVSQSFEQKSRVLNSFSAKNYSREKLQNIIAKCNKLSEGRMMTASNFIEVNKSGNNTVRYYV